VQPLSKDPNAIRITGQAGCIIIFLIIKKEKSKGQTKKKKSHVITSQLKISESIE
jgi:hypothetical protein